MFTQSPFLGQVRLVPFAGYRPYTPALGLIPSPAERSQYLAVIAAGAQKIAQVRKWIASRIDQDPMLLKTFREQYISDNFWGYDDLVTKDQYYVDQTQRAFQSENPSDWDLSDEYTGRVDEWAKAIDIMYSAMQEYGTTPLPGVPGGGLPPGVKPPGMLPGVQPGVQPGAITAPPPKAGIATNDLLLGGAVAVGLGVLIAALA